METPPLWHATRHTKQFTICISMGQSNSLSVCMYAEKRGMSKWYLIGTISLSTEWYACLPVSEPSSNQRLIGRSGVSPTQASLASHMELQLDLRVQAGPMSHQTQHISNNSSTQGVVFAVIAALHFI